MAQLPEYDPVTLANKNFDANLRQTLDTEHNNIKSVLDAARSNLKAIQRDDQKLANDSVHPDALDIDTLDLMGGWTPKGDWATGTDYKIKDQVRQGAQSYVCVIAHTSGTFATDLSNGRWMAVGAGSDLVLDEDDFSSDSTSKAPSQQSVKKHVDKVNNRFDDRGGALVSGGSGGAFTLTTNETITALAAGQVFAFRANHKPGGAATLDVDGTGSKAIKKNHDEALVDGDIEQDQMVVVMYQDQDDIWEMLSQAPPPADIVVQSAQTTSYTLTGDSEVVPVDISSGDFDASEKALGSMSAGAIVEIKIETDAGQSSSNKARLLDSGGSEVWTGFQAGESVRVAYDGTNRRIVHESRVPARAVIAKTADQSVSSGATANALDADASEQIDQGGNFASGAYTAPFAGRCKIIPRVISGRLESFASNYSLDGTTQIDWSAAQSSTTGVSNVPSFEFDVTAGQVVRPQVTNLEDDISHSFFGDAAEDESLFIIEMIERHR